MMTATFMIFTLKKQDIKLMEAVLRCLMKNSCSLKAWLIPLSILKMVMYIEYSIKIKMETFSISSNQSNLKIFLKRIKYQIIHKTMISNLIWLFV